MYTIEDFKIDLNYSSGKSQLNDNEQTFFRNELIEILRPVDINEIGSFFLDVLLLNKVRSVSKNQDTPYLIHKSYPSARSMYPLLILVCVEKNRFIFYDCFEEQFFLCTTHNMHYAKANDIIILNRQIKIEKYKKIHKTLENLELGHLLYNVEKIIKIYATEYKKYIKDDVVVLRPVSDEIDLNIDKDIFEEWYRKVDKRTSGPYNYPLFNEKIEKPEIELAKIISSNLFDTRAPFFVDIINLVNNNVSGFLDEETGFVIPYYKLNKEYSYINFRYAQYISLFCIKESLLYEDDPIICEVIQYLGYLAQEVCINNACEEFFNRPVKQVVDKVWREELLDDSVLNNLIPFYAILGGKFKYI